MGQLLDLPDELLTHICTLICDSDRLALFEVIYVNKRLHGIASPLLVRHWPFYPSTSYKQAPVRFALHLVRNPQLRRNVKSMVFDEQTLIGDDDPWAGVDEIHELAVTARQRFPDLASDPIWCHGLAVGFIDSVATLLLVLCTRIESLDLMIPHYTESTFQVLKLMSLALKHRGPQRPLASLQLVVLRWYDYEDPEDIQCAAPLFHLPNVKTLALSAFSDKIPLRTMSDEKDRDYNAELGLDPDIHETRFPVRTSPVEELFLESACLTSQGLLTVVSACKRLKKLVFTCGNPDTATDDDRYSAPLTRQALLLHAASLEELAFNLERHRSTHPLDCLKDCSQQLKKLKRLTMDIHILYYHDISPNERMLDCLPTSLEYLGLECDLASYQPHVLRYIEVLCTVLKACGPGQRFCALKTLEIWLFVYGGIDEKIYDPVSELARERGIEFKFTHGRHGEGNAWETMGMMPDPYPPIRP